MVRLLLLHRLRMRLRELLHVVERRRRMVNRLVLNRQFMSCRIRVLIIILSRHELLVSVILDIRVFQIEAYMGHFGRLLLRWRRVSHVEVRSSQGILFKSRRPGYKPRQLGRSHVLPLRFHGVVEFVSVGHVKRTM